MKVSLPYLAVAVVCAVLVPAAHGQQPAGSLPEWVAIDYGAIIDARRLTHSGEPVSTVLARLDGRALPPTGQRPGDLLAHRLLDPLLEPYAFVMPDLLDSLAPPRADPWIEVGALWQPGEAQPAWAELLRARRYLVESNGRGTLRAFVPLPLGSVDPQQAGSSESARVAWNAAWPVLRHVVATELARREADEALTIEVHAYDHRPAQTVFVLGTRPHRAELTGAAADGSRPPLNLAAWQDFLESGLLLEGGRLEQGRVRLFGAATERPATLLGRPVSLADLAVAYRAVFRGGLAEPYMSLDRARSPQTSIVNYGGRLQDTRLGWVSLLCDIRFKTFSQGIDIVESLDVRDRVRDSLPEFRTHLERFARDPRSLEISGQQTRLWFYPDNVDLTLSPQADVMVVRRARMTAASERVDAETFQRTAEQDPPWTRATIAEINQDYPQLGRLFPELDDLDQVVRLLSFFTWLRLAGREGQLLPELDALLAVELPASPTPRRFPQLLAFNAMPPPVGQGPVDVINQAEVGRALDRLAPRHGVLPADQRLRRARELLDPQRQDHAALLARIDGIEPGSLDDAELDLLTYRALRLTMHQLVLSTVRGADRQRLVERSKTGEQLRVFSVGIGGLDLGMERALGRASRRSLRPGEQASTPTTTQPAQTQQNPPAPAPAAPREEWKVATPATESRLPGHGADACLMLPVDTTDPAAWCRSGTHVLGRHMAQGKVAQTTVLFGVDGPWPSGRVVRAGDGSRGSTVERLHEGRLILLRFQRHGNTWQVRPGGAPPGSTAVESAVPVTAGELPPGLALFETSAGSPADGLRWTLSAAGQDPRSGRVDRDVLRRLVLGRDVDLTPTAPLAGLSPILDAVSGSEVLLVPEAVGRTSPPWESAQTPIPGDADPVGFAEALQRWWFADEDTVVPAVVVGATASAAARWAEAPTPGSKPLLLVPAGALPPPLDALASSLESSWPVGRIVEELPTRKLPRLVVLVSAESPAKLGERVRTLARDAAMQDRLLAVFSLSGPLRADLPASLLADGRLAGLGVAHTPPVDLPGQVSRLREFGAELQRSGGRSRVEQLDGPFLWYF